MKNKNKNTPTREVKQCYETTTFSKRSKKSTQPSQCVLSTRKIIFSNSIQIKPVHSFFVNMQNHLTYWAPRRHPTRWASSQWSHTTPRTPCHRAWIPAPLSAHPSIECRCAAPQIETPICTRLQGLQEGGKRGTLYTGPPQVRGPGKVEVTHDLIFCNQD